MAEFERERKARKGHGRKWKMSEGEQKRKNV